MFKTNFSGHNKISGAQKSVGGHCLQMPNVAMGLGTRIAKGVELEENLYRDECRWCLK